MGLNHIRGIVILVFSISLIELSTPSGIPDADVSEIVLPDELEIRGFRNGSTVEVKLGEKVFLYCSIKNGIPATKLKWLRNGIEIGKDRVKDLKVNSTSIKITAKLNDNGSTYSCVAKHPALTRALTTNILLRVLGNCSHQITSPHGEIISPNYPDNYPSRKDCAWLFTTKPGHRIKLLFKDFELETHQMCAYDRIEAYDGDSDESPTLGMFCGSRVVPHPILASGNRMYFVFKSDASVQRKGFKATHTTICGGRLLAHRKMELLYSHVKYGDQNYDNKADCDWLVQGLNDQRVKLRFLTFEVEHKQDSGYDYVEVYDGDDDSAKSFGKFSGNKVPPEFYSSGDSLMVRFRSDDTINSKGFSAAYAVLD